jgi:hypothetical protein
LHQEIGHVFLWGSRFSDQEPPLHDRPGR